MKVLILFIVILFSDFGYTQGSGDLDLDFGYDNNGKLIIEHNLGTIPPLGEGSEYGDAIYIYPDRSMLIAGIAYHTNSQDIDMVVTKLTSGGQADLSWGNNGHVIVGFDLGGSNQDRLYDIDVLSDGSILLIGSAEFSGEDTDFAIAKLTSQGNLDTSFSGDGKLTVHFDGGGTNQDVAHSVLSFNQAYFVVGFANQSTGSDFAITKILNDGSIDSSFGSNGRKTFDLANSTNSIDVAKRIFFSNTSTGFWITGSASENDNSQSPAIIKLDYAGSIDNTFSTNGKYVYTDARTGTSIKDVVQHPSLDEFVFVGPDGHPENTNLKDDCGLTYVNTVSQNAGEPVADTFNFNLDPNPFLFDFNSDCNSAIFSDDDNKLILIGNLYPDDVSSISMGVMRLNSMSVVSGTSSHSIDTDFGTDGRTAIGFITQAGQTIDSPSAVGTDFNKKIIISGTATNANSVQKIGVARLIGNGGQDPTVTITMPAHGTSYVENDPVTFAGTATDPEDGTISGIIKWSSNIDGFLSSGANISSPTHFSDLSVGIHQITASISDSDGQSDSQSIAIEVTDFPDAPQVSMLLPSANAVFNVGDSITFFASAVDDEDGDVSTSLTWTSNIDGALGTGNNFQLNTLSIGQHSITASVIDSNGQSDFDSRDITVQVVQQNAPTVTISTPMNGSIHLLGTNISFMATASDIEDGDLSSVISWVSNLDGQLANTGSFTTSNLSVGVHTISAEATDSGGLRGSDLISLTVQISQNAPSVTIQSPNDNNVYMQGETITFAGSAFDVEDGDISGLLNWNSNIDGFLGTASSFTNNILSPGQHQITASVTDSDGLIGSTQKIITILNNNDLIFMNGFEQ